MAQRYETSFRKSRPSQPPPPPAPPSGGTPDVLSIAGTLTWGVIPGPTEKTITVTGDGSGDIATGSLAFSGDTAAFLLVSVDGDPVENGSGPIGEWLPSADGDYYFAMNEGQSKTFTFRALYVDGLAKSMTIDAKRADTTIDDTVIATATVEDSVYGAALLAGALAIYSGRDLTVESPLLVNAPVLQDLLGVGGDVELVSINANAVVSIISTAFQAASVSKAARLSYSPIQAGGWATGQLPAPAALAAALASAYASGIIFFRNNDLSGMSGQYLHELWNFDSTKTVETSNSAVFGWELNPGGAHAMELGAGALTHQTSQLLFDAGNSTGKWYSFAWTIDGGNVRTWLSRQGQAFGGIASATNAVALTGARNSIRIWNRVAKSTAGNAGTLVNDIATIIPIVAGAQDANLQSIHEAWA